MKKIIKSCTIYTLGLFIMSLGIAFSIISNLGVSPVSSVPFVISRVFELDLGLCTTCIFSSYIILQYIILRKDFKITSLLQIICSTVFGFFVSFATKLTSPIVIGESYIIRLAFCGISIVLISIGIFLYLVPNLVPMPSEGVMKAMSFKFKMPVHRSKTIFDCTVVAIAIIISLIAFKEVIGIREGTVLSAVFVGFGIKLVQKLLGDRVSGFINN